MRSTIRTRIAPSPTGLFHIGTARAALFNYLYAKKNGGQFILRIEDTDKERSKKEFEDDIFNGLSWLGIIPDEGPKEGGMYGPYRQSERLLFYVKAVDRLLAEENAYYCFHDDYYLEQEKKRLLAEKKPPIHECEYRELSLKEAEQKKETLSSFVIRFKSPKERTVAFKDHIRGPISFQSDLLGDFSIARDVAEPLYNLAVVVDDHEMNITHVIRGEDHISNTPKHILLFEALGEAMPQFAHLPLILGKDRAKRYVDTVGLPPARRDLVASNPPRDYLISFYDQVLSARIVPIRLNDSFQTIVDDMIEAVSSRRRTVEQAIAKANADIKAALNERQ